MAKINEFNTSHIIKHGEDIFHGLRWAYGIVVCPSCGSVHIKDLGHYHYKCNSCKNHFTDKTNTIMHHSKLSVGQWMQAMFEIIATNEISGNELALKLGISVKSAWYVHSKIKMCMSMDNIMLSGEIAQDEMYIGGLLGNWHYGRKLRELRTHGLLEEDERKYTKGAARKLAEIKRYPVFAMHDSNNVVMYAMPNPIRKEYIHGLFKKHVAANGHSVVVSDESALYNDWEKITGVPIYTNCHSNNHYITANGLSSNKVENAFSWYKRGFTGRITHCKNKYLQLYLNEFCFRFNTRNMSMEDRWKMLVGMCVGKTITNNDITNYNSLNNFDVNRKWQRHIYTLKDIKEMFEVNPIIDEMTLGKTTYYRKDFIVPDKPF